MKILVIAALAVVAAAPAFAEEKTAKCLLQVDGVKYLDGRCEFSADADGSFSIGSLKKADTRIGPIPEYYAMVNIDAPGVASGAWNGEPYASHAHNNFGELRRSERHRACWENQTARVCAW